MKRPHVSPSSYHRVMLCQLWRFSLYTACQRLTSAERLSRMAPGEGLRCLTRTGAGIDLLRSIPGGFTHGRNQQTSVCLWIGEAALSTPTRVIVDCSGGL